MLPTDFILEQVNASSSIYYKEIRSSAINFLNLIPGEINPQDDLAPILAIVYLNVLRLMVTHISRKGGTTIKEN